jgi:hypothetical protein
MAEASIPFFTQTAVLDRFIKSDPTTLAPEVLETVIKSLKTNADLQSYFFRSQPNIAWGRVLMEGSFFKRAPDPVKSGRGYVLSRWEAQEFLKSVAKQLPDVILEHIRSIEGNPVYFEHAITLIRESGADTAESALPTILEWLKNPQMATQISEECVDLLKYLAKQEKQESALQLLHALTEPYPSAKAKDHSEIVLFGSATSILPIDEYHLGFFNEALGLLTQLNAEKTGDILEHHLCTALRLEGETEKDSGYKTRSFWRSAIEDSGQDVFPEFKDVLLIGLRDSMEARVRQGSQTVRPIVERYLTDEHEILRRLGLHLLQTFPDKFTGLIAEQLLTKANLDDTGIHHELFMLLRAGYRYLNSDEQRTLIGWITEGPPAETVERVAEWAQIDEKDRDNYVKSYSEVWIRDRLSMLEDDLDAETKNQLQELISRRGKPEHAAFTHWTSGAYFVSEVSPTTTIELSRKSPSELLSYLSEWQPNKESLLGPQRESHGVLGRDAAQTIISNLRKYGSILLDVASLRPEYASGFLFVESDAIGSETLWDLRLSVCEHMLTNSVVRTDMRRNVYEGGWVGFRHGVMSLLEKAVKDSESAAPERFLPRIRDLLLILSEDPDPDLESDRPAEGWLGHHDPLTVAINHIRSEAVAALILYASNKRERDIKQNVEGESERIEPEVKDVLTRRVEQVNEPSLAVHSVFGRELNRLYWLDKQWTEEQIAKIFPMDENPESIDFFVAAWDSYVISTGVIYEELFKLLKPHYERAIENVSRGYVTKTHLNPMQRLADHLLVEYFNSDYDIITAQGQESLIATFFQKTSPEARGQAAWAVAQQCGQHRDRLKDFWPRGRSLWSWRANEAARSNYASDFMEEMAAFSLMLNIAADLETIDSLWPLLEAFIPYVGRTEGWDRIWHNLQEYLGKEVERDPMRVIQLYRLMHDQLQQPLWYYDKEAVKILETGAADVGSRADTVLLIDKITRTGNYQFKYIVDKYLP